MGKNKLRKFSEMETIDFVYQYPFGVLKEQGGFTGRGRWHSEIFGNDNPIVVELGCGKGEYTVGLARKHPDVNYIGIDIKGARMWRGATMARDEGLKNVAFIRTDIELLDQFFAPGEVAGIWITFPDPQMKKVRKRLTSTRFMDLYRKVLEPGGKVNLKTDSPFLYTYTGIMARHNSHVIDILEQTADVYNDMTVPGELRTIQTHYERQWLDRGLTIKYISLAVKVDGTLTEPDVEIEHDTYRSYSRGQVQCPELCTPAVTFNKQTQTADS